jgi:hypothetical protein
MFDYHVLHTIPLSAQEYQQQFAEADANDTSITNILGSA